MPGTRTAPTVNGTPQYKVVSLTWYDHTGDVRTDSYQFDAAATDGQIETFAAAMQALSNATLWRIQVSAGYNSVGDSSNALEQVWENVKDNLVFLAKDTANNGFNVFVPSPINGVFIENTETIDPTQSAISDLLAAMLAMKSGYSIVSGRFTHRKQINRAVRI